MGRIIEILGGAFWGGVATLLGLAVIVTVLRLAKNKVSATSGVVSKVGQVTGLSV